MEREKRIKSGGLLEIDFYPVKEGGQRIPTRAPKSEPSRQEQTEYNQRQATKKMIRLVNCNFDSSDYYMALTYPSSSSPQTENEARKDMVNFLRRVKTRRERELKALNKKLKQAQEALKALSTNSFIESEIVKLKADIKKLKADFKYIYVLECVTYKSGRYAGKNNFHFHMFMTGGLTPKVIEDIWGHGGIKCENFAPDKYGLESAAAYMCKDPKGRKRFVYSRNLKKPIESKTKDGHISPNTVAKMATQRVDDAGYWERRYRGYRFVRCYSRFNNYNNQWYVSVVMYKKTDSPSWCTEWNIDDWITSDYIERRKNARQNC